MMNLKDKVILITGAGRGFGRSLAKALAKEGAIIAANDITPVNLDIVMDEITESGGRAKAYITDIAKKMPVQGMIHEILEDWGRIDILINHANVKPRKSILEIDEWDWRRTVEVNLTGVFLTLQSVGRVMREQGGGTIINVIGSIQTGRSAHAASVSAVEQLTQSAAEEFQAYNISVQGFAERSDQDPEPQIQEFLQMLRTTLSHI